LGVVTTGVVSISLSLAIVLLLELPEAAAAAVIVDGECSMDLGKCGVSPPPVEVAESGRSLGVDSISSEDVEDRLLLSPPESPLLLIEATPIEPPTRSRPVILLILVANMSPQDCQSHLLQHYKNK